jgi:predicted nucleotidyltransferase
MANSSRLPADLPARLVRAGAYLAGRPDVAFACVFGGVARGRISPLSDIDVAVYLSGRASPTRTKLKLVNALAGILGTDAIDLVVLNSAPISLRGRILRDRRIIADREPFLRHRYESLTTREFFDFAVRERAILERRYLHG